MSRTSLVRASAIWLGVALGMWLCAHETDAQRPEGALGYDADIPPIVGMSGTECTGVVIARGTLTAAAHEIQDGSFSLSHGGAPIASVVMPRGAVALLRAADMNGQDVELVLRPITPRTRQELIR